MSIIDLISSVFHAFTPSRTEIILVPFNRINFVWVAQKFNMKIYSPLICWIFAPVTSDTRFASDMAKFMADNWLWGLPCSWTRWLWGGLVLLGSEGVGKCLARTWISELCQICPLGAQPPSRALPVDLLLPRAQRASPIEICNPEVW
jgi:hypothetical protein